MCLTGHNLLYAQELQLQPQPKDRDMLHEAKQHQQLLQELKDNLDEDLVLYLDLTDRCYKKVSHDLVPVRWLKVVSDGCRAGSASYSSHHMSESLEFL